MGDFEVYEDQENRFQGARPKQVFRSNSVQARSVFGVLSTNNQTSGNVRIQPSRNAKQVSAYEAPSKVYQDENAYAKPKSFSTTSSTNSSGLSFKIYCDDDSKGENKTSSSSSLLSSQENSLRENSSRNKSSELDKNSLQYAALKLKEQITLPQCLTELPRSSSLNSTSSACQSDDMDVDEASASCTALSLSPNESVHQKNQYKQREEKMWDMAEYSSDIYKYLREAETRHRPRENYMSKQTDITVSMRWILVDWMVEVSEEYNLSTETLYLALSYIDRFLSLMAVKRDKLQLVGTTAMFIASKYEEIYPPDVTQFAYITDNTYKVSHILRMEHLILKVLCFDMAVPTVYAFINLFSRTLKCDEETVSLAQFIAELSVLNCDPFLKYLPSEIAAASIAVANFTMGKEVWPSKMTKTYTYTLEDLRKCYTDLNAAYLTVNETKQHSIREKYEGPKYHNVGKLSARKDLPFDSLPL